MFFFSTFVVFLIGLRSCLGYENSCHISGLYDFESESSRDDYVEYLIETGMDEKSIQILKYPKRINFTKVDHDHFKYYVASLTHEFVKEFTFENGKEQKDTFFDWREFDSCYFVYDNILVHRLKFPGNITAHNSFLFTDNGFVISFSCKGKSAIRNYRRIKSK